MWRQYISPLFQIDMFHDLSVTQQLFMFICSEKTGGEGLEKLTFFEGWKC